MGLPAFAMLRRSSPKREARRRPPGADTWVGPYTWGFATVTFTFSVLDFSPSVAESSIT